MRRIIVVILIFLVTLLPMSVAHATQSDYFLNRINYIRSQNGISTLSYYSPLNSIAQNWVQYISSNNRLMHNMNLPYEISGWKLLGENVGYANNIPQLEQALENSSEHYTNMVRSDYRLIGIAVTQSSDGRYWVVEDFMVPATTSTVVVSPPRVIYRYITRPKVVTTTSTSTTTTTIPIPQQTQTKPNTQPFLEVFYQLILSDGVNMLW